MPSEQQIRCDACLRTFGRASAQDSGWACPSCGHLLRAEQVDPSGAATHHPTRTAAANVLVAVFIAMLIAVFIFIVLRVLAG